MNRKCNTCGYAQPGEGYYKDKHHCHSFVGPFSGRTIDINNCSCEKHATPEEILAHKLLGSGVDDAKSTVARLPASVLKLALQIETSGNNRKTMITIINRQMKKLEKKNL